ncbi:MAG TPA: endonuclease/exonuclease/phosphatase family protein [Candidatus Limnocylindrales bacterium]
MTLRLVSYNIRKGGRRRSRLISEVLRRLDPDLVVLQEAVDPWVVAEVAREIDARVLLSAPGRSVAVLSRMGELEGCWHRGASGPRYAEVLLPSIGGRLLGLHLTAGLSGRGERRRAREAEQVLATAGAGPGMAGTILVGDFNAVAPGDLLSVRRLPTWIRILLRVDGGISTRVMQRLIGAGFTDAFRRRNPDSHGATIPSDAPAVRLDYFLLGSAIASRLLECRVAVVDPVLLAAASDHLPIVLELSTEAVPVAESEHEAAEPQAIAAAVTADRTPEDATDQQRDGLAPGLPRNRSRRTMTT